MATNIMTDIRKNVIQFSITNFLQLSVLLTALVNYPHFLTNICGYSNKYAGTLVGLLAVANLAAVFPLGLLLDRVSPKKIFAGSQICTIFFFLMLPFCRSKTLLALLFVAGGIGFSALRICLQVLYYKYLPEEKRSSNISVFLSAGFLGFAAGGMTGGYVQDLASMVSVPALPFYAAAGLTVILLVWTLFLPDTKPEKIKSGEYIRDIWDIKVIVIISIFILMGLHYGVEQYGFPKLVQEGLGLSSRQMGNLYLCIGIVLGGMAFLLREFFETRKKHFYYFGIALIISGLFQGITFYAEGFTSLLAIRLGHVVGDTLIMIMSGIVVVSIFPGSRMGGNVGFVSLLNTMGQFGGAFFTGWAIDMNITAVHRMWSPYLLSFTASGIILAATGAAFILFRKKLGIAARSSAERME